VVEVFRRTGVGLGAVELGVRSSYRTVLRPDGSIQSKHFAPQTQTSWSLIYATFKGAFGDLSYHQAKTLVKFDQDHRAGTVTAQFEDGTRESGDLLIGADGGNSIVRQQLWPTMRPTYAGYLAWRGLLPEDSMPPAALETLHGDFGFANNRGSHILGYLVPGERNDVRPGHRLYNCVWYRAADERLLTEIMTDRNGQARGYAIPEGNGSRISIAIRRRCFRCRWSRRRLSLLPKQSATPLRTTWWMGVLPSSEMPPQSRGPTPQPAPPRRPRTLLLWRTSCRPFPTMSPRRSLVGSRTRSRSASTSASKVRRRATTCCSTGGPSRGSGEHHRFKDYRRRLIDPALLFYPTLPPTHPFVRSLTHTLLFWFILTD
jgi:hypothetical protein